MIPQTSNALPHLGLLDAHHRVPHIQRTWATHLSDGGSHRQPPDNTRYVTQRDGTSNHLESSASDGGYVPGQDFSRIRSAMRVKWLSEGIYPNATMLFA